MANILPPGAVRWQCFRTCHGCALNGRACLAVRLNASWHWQGSSATTGHTHATQPGVEPVSPAVRCPSWRRSSPGAGCAVVAESVNELPIGLPLLPKNAGQPVLVRPADEPEPDEIIGFLELDHLPAGMFEYPCLRVKSFRANRVSRCSEPVPARISGRGLLQENSCSTNAGWRRTKSRRLLGVNAFLRLPARNEFVK